MIKGHEPDFLIIGLQKSGTYWLTALLNAHPEITAVPPMYGGQSGVEEGHFFDTLGKIKDGNIDEFKAIFNRSHNGFYSDLVKNVEKDGEEILFEKFKKRYDEWCYFHKKKKFFGDKTTEYIFHLDLIEKFYSGIKKICILRNPRDRIVSFYFHQKRKGRLDDKKISDSFIKEYCLERVKKEYEIILKYAGNILYITYEDLSNDSEVIVKKMLSYLNVNMGSEIIKKMIKAGDFKKLTSQDKKVKDIARVRGEEELKSHYRKGIIGDWKNCFTKKQLKLIDIYIGKCEEKVFNYLDIKY